MVKTPSVPGCHHVKHIDADEPASADVPLSYASTSRCSATWRYAYPPIETLNPTFTSARSRGAQPVFFAPLALLVTGAASLAQSGSIEIALPSDIPMPLASRIDLLSQQFGIETEVAATLTRIEPPMGNRSSSVLFYSVTPGAYVVGQRIDLPLTLRPGSSALDGDRLVLRTSVPGERLLLERIGGTWRVAGTFGEAQPLAPWEYEQGMALSGDRAVIVNDTRRTIDVYKFRLSCCFRDGIPAVKMRV